MEVPSAATQPGDPKPLHPAAAAQRSMGIPRPLTTFIGRDRELAAVHALFDRDDVRLVTLTGPGGVGKTRLALEAVKEPRAYPDGVWFVALAPVRDPSLVGPTLATSLGLASSGPHPVETLLANHLRNKRALVILDNFEHVLDAATLIADLLAASRTLTVLVTSRSTLRISGEHVFNVPPLGLPDDETEGDLAQILESASVQLFVDRAKARSSTFALTSANATAVAAICQRLDGLPLAIELAAARVNVLTPAALEARLTDRFRLLTGGQRDVPQRLRSMRDAIAWSYDLLTPDEQRFFRRLAVFVGGFTLESAESVCVTPDHPAMDALTGITSLVDHSLARRVDTGPGATRFMMLETIREFAAEQLVTSGEEDAVRDRHATWFLEYVRSDVSISSPFTNAGDVGRLSANHANFRTALAWLEVSGRESDLTTLVLRLGWFWYIGAHFSEGESWYERVLKPPPADRPAILQCDLLTGAAFLAHYRYNRYGGSSSARGYLEEAVTIAHDAGDALREAEATFYLATIAEDTGHYAEADAGFRRAHALYGLASQPWNQMGCDYHLGVVTYGNGDLHAARRLIEGAQVVAQRMNDRFTPAWCRDFLILFACDEGDAHRAMALLSEHRRELVSDNSQRPEFLVALAGVIATVHADYLLAARLFGAHGALAQDAPLPLPEGDAIERYAALAREHLGNDLYEAAWTEGRRWRPAKVDVEIDGLLSGASERRQPETNRVAESTKPITDRELEVLRLLAEGMSDAEIATALFISRRTVGNHVGHIYQKLDVTGRAAAAAHAVRHGLA